MARMRRFFSRRDVQVFLLLLIPCVWAYGLCRFGSKFEAGDIYRSSLVFLAMVIGPGLLLLGAGTGVERYRTSSRPGTGARIFGEIFTPLGSALAGNALFLISVTLASLGAKLSGGLSWDWPLQYFRGEFYPPGGLFTDSHPLHLYYISARNWKACVWFGGSWIGWVVGYGFGRRIGRFIPAVFASGTVAGGIGYALYRMTTLEFGGDWVRLLARERSDPRTWYSSAFFIDASLFLASLILVAFLVETVILIRRWRLRRSLVWGAALALWIPVFLVHRSTILNQVEPWPPLCLDIKGLDPVTGRLWATFGSNYWNQYLYALDIPDHMVEADGGRQILSEIPEVELGKDRIAYDPYAALLWIRHSEDKSSRLIAWRTPRGVEAVDPGPGDWGYDWCRVRCPGPAWYAFPDSEYEVFRIESEDGTARREFRSHLFLYCPETGTSTTAVTFLNALVISMKPEWAGSGYEIWPETVRLWPPTSQKAVRVEFEDREMIRSLAADGFLMPELFGRPERWPVYAFVDETAPYYIDTVISFRMYRSEPGVQIQKIPSPDPNLGCEWDAKTRDLKIYFGGIPLTGVSRYASGETAPVWSPDGQYLAHLFWNGRQWMIRLGYPGSRDLLGVENAGEPGLWWSVDSGWLAVKPGTADRVVVIRFPDFRCIEIRPPGESSIWETVQPLHDGSLALVSDGRAFLWRPGWEEPACVYDPGRETVVRNSELRITN